MATAAEWWGKLTGEQRQLADIAARKARMTLGDVAEALDVKLGTQKGMKRAVNVMKGLQEKGIVGEMARSGSAPVTMPREVYGRAVSAEAGVPVGVQRVQKMLPAPPPGPAWGTGPRFKAAAARLGPQTVVEAASGAIPLGGAAMDVATPAVDLAEEGAILSKSLPSVGRLGGIGRVLGKVAGPLAIASLVYEGGKGIYDTLVGDPRKAAAEGYAGAIGDQDVTAREMGLQMQEGEASRRGVLASAGEAGQVQSRYAEGMDRAELMDMLSGRAAEVAQLQVQSRPSVAELYAQLGSL